MMANAKKIIITLSVLLGLSVCGNAFLGGLVLAKGPLMMGPPPHEMTGGEHRGPGGPEGSRLRGLREFGRSLPPDVREPIMEAFKADREEMGQHIRAIMESRRTSMEALKAEPFDATALREALKAQRAAQQATQEHVHEQLVGVIETLTSEQRAQLAGSAARLFK